MEHHNNPQKMNRISTKIIRLFAVAALLGWAGLAARAAAGPDDEKALANNLVAALAHGDYPRFIAYGDAQFRQMKKEQFDAMAGPVAPSLKAGYELTYLGQLNKKKENFHVTLWRMVFRDGSDDALVSVGTKDGKVGGFWIE